MHYMKNHRDKSYLQEAVSLGVSQGKAILVCRSLLTCTIPHVLPCTQESEGLEECCQEANKNCEQT
jgi:hypothetical protein